MKKIHSLLLCCLLLPALSLTLNAQVYSNKVVPKRHDTVADSVVRATYNYILPIWGKRAAAKGFNLPYSAGIGINYLWQRSDLVIDNLKVGFNNGEMYDLDDIVKFDKAQSSAQAITVRPDFWLFPFLNIYGIFGASSASTDVGFGVWIPDSTSTPKEIFHTETKVDFQATSFGFGMTPTIGVAGLWMAFDMNFTWTDVPQLEKPAFAFVFGPRIGKTFNFKKKECSLSVWAGGFRLALNTGTSGSINLNEVLPIDELQSKVEVGYARVDSSQQQVDMWWNSLSQAEQKNPLNSAKYEASNAALAKAGEILYAAEGAISEAGNATVQYSMDKRPKDKWNFIVGTQFQVNKHWMIRAEGGFFGTRTQFIGGLQYRFGL
jgi:hypothetical protein